MRSGCLDGSGRVAWMGDEHVQKWYTHWERDSQHNISYFPNRRFKSLVKYQAFYIIIISPHIKKIHSCRPFRVRSNKLLRIKEKHPREKEDIFGWIKPPISRCFSFWIKTEPKKYYHSEAASRSFSLFAGPHKDSDHSPAARSSGK